ncbi:MAG: CAP domain-containing protein [Oscillospiraceae bacterium]|nr:CAP domain-containing protein [Oscillospiraceae bacterium]
MAMRKTKIPALALILLSLSLFAFTTACTQKNNGPESTGIPEPARGETGSFAQYSKEPPVSEPPKITADEQSEDMTEFSPPAQQTTEPPETTQPPQTEPTATEAPETTPTATEATKPPKPAEAQSIIKNVPVTSIYIETDKYTYTTGETVGFKVTVYPGDATDKSYSVDISGAKGKLTGNSSLAFSSGGLATITVFAANGISGKTQIEVIDLIELAAEVIRLTNMERANHGLPELSGGNSLLNSAAIIRAGEIIGTFSHTRPNGSSCFSVLDDVGLNYLVAGENICSGLSSPKAAVDAWMGSQGHKDNILDPEYTQIGVGVARDGNGDFHWAQMFLLGG